ncbi:zinc finger CHC2-family protein [Sporocytophaga myxococcoides]|uniref:Zinc finger CHC2-family protein n=1 Tax=Sporocytophaga myxococcoides TaxID=153721 RepID=A0A098LH54_9BACT|nr:toprim domain-containing protein [Sporocytophaga myxococcoides]GAL85769.1 zinc finger CHC2-family protein [Sporocytophaga myxococcoides]
MEIKDIKAELTLADILRYYGLKPDKSMRLNCPFHEDKTPSMQVYHKTHTCYCFSSNCPTHGRSLDVIDFIMHKERCSKGEAIKKAKDLLSGSAPKPTIPQQVARTAVLTNMFTYFKNAVHNSKPARDYIEQRGLDYTKLEIGYNTGQFHHGERKDEALIQSCLKVGLLSPFGSNTRTGGQAYKPFAKYCLAFALRNRSGQVTGMYFRSTVNEDNQKHYYLKESSGLYPHYPKAETEKLIIGESIIDTATLLQIEAISKEYSLLAAYGTNRLTPEHIEAIRELKDLKEIIFAFDNDEAGNKAAEKYAAQLRELLPHITFSKLELPCKDVNETAQAHQHEIFHHLLESRTFIFSTGGEPQKETGIPVEKEKSQPEASGLNTRNPFKIGYKTATANYYIQGGVSKQLDSMKVTLVIEHPEISYKTRNKLDLYEDKQVEKLCKEVAEKLNLRKDLLEADIYKLTDLLDEFREQELLSASNNREDSEELIIPLTVQERQQIKFFGKKENLINNLNELLGKAGIVGEEKNRIFLLIIAASYKMPETLHALIQGSSGSGKTRLLKQISDCIPKERVTKLTRVSDKVLYNYPEKYFINRLLCLEDIDGLSEEAEFAFRELQSNGELNSATSSKLENGQIIAGQKTVKGPIASLACTTRGEIYEDNMSRCFLVSVDESAEQTKRVITYQNNRAAGGIQEEEEQKAKHFIQRFIRELKPFKVVNPYANKIHLPEEAHKIRRLNDLFQSFVKMVTVLNQYQRKKDDKQRLITEIADIETAVEIMFESIVLKVDELDGSLRQFYEKLKSHIGKKSRNYEFTRFEVREATGLGKTQQHHYINQLIEVEYLQQYGFANRGFRYKIVHWDNYTAMRERIKRSLQNQLETIKSEHQRTPAERQK